MKRARAALVVALLFFAMPFAAFAYNCDSLVVDGARVFGDETGRVEAAAEKLRDLGVHIRVHTVSSFGNFGNLDNYEIAVEKSCLSWRAGNGTKNNLIVLMLEVEHREIGLWYGDLWKPSLDGQWQAIKDLVMIPRLRDGNIAEAFEEGLYTITLHVERQKNPPPAPAMSSGSATVVVSEPTDFGGLWIVLGALVAVAFAIFLIVAI